MPADLPTVDADLIVLAGDIHNQAAGLHWASEVLGKPQDGNRPAPTLIYVPGNHEYYDGEFDTVESLMRETAARLPHFHFLNGDVVTDTAEQWRVIGTTLWTDFALFGDSPEQLALAHATAARSLYDYQGIIQVRDAGHGASRAFSTRDSLDLHRQARGWLAAELARPFAGKTIVVTHHAPHRQSLAARYADDLSSAGFISDLGPLLGPPVALWIHGHTHTSFDYVENGTRVVCNPRGYVDRARDRIENRAFAWDFVAEI